MHISKVVEYIKNEINFSQDFSEDNVFVTLRIEPILRIIENLEQSHKDILEITKENIKKDKIIDEMIGSFIDLGFGFEYCNNDDRCINDCDKCIKQYFEQKTTNNG